MAEFINPKPICYLCGLEIERKDLSPDHVPPKQFYLSELRIEFNISKLETFPAHCNCNASYQNDEDYFKISIGSLAMDSSLVGQSLWNDIKKGIQRPEPAGAFLAKKISDEFSDRTDAGIILPGDIAMKRFDLMRVKRVIWKVVRGLFYKEYKVILPETKLNKFGFIQPEYTPPSEVAKYLFESPSKGLYKDIFDYKYISTNKFHYWGLHLWEAIIVTCLFHVADCKCEECLGASPKPTSPIS